MHTHISAHQFCFLTTVWCSLIMVMVFTSGPTDGFLIPYGESEGFKTLGHSEELIKLVKLYNYFGKVYHSVKVMENGLVRLVRYNEEPEDVMEDMFPTALPLNDVPFVAPYWTKPGVASNTTVWHKQEENKTKLTLFTELIKASFPGRYHAKPEWLLVLTWEASLINDTQDPMTNTFQLALFEMDNQHYLILNYVNITWGLWTEKPKPHKDHSVVVGYDGGPRQFSLMLSGPGPNVLTLGSNINISGLWIFRTDQYTCHPKSITGIVILVALLFLLIGAVLASFCTCFCLKRKKTVHEDLKPLQKNEEKPDVTVNEQDPILTSDPDKPAQKTYAINFGMKPKVVEPAGRRIIVIKKSETP
ncbi:alpha-tectorin-like [Argonauta hians]